MNTQKRWPTPAMQPAKALSDHLLPLIDSLGEPCGRGVTRLRLGEFAVERVEPTDVTYGPAMSISRAGAGLLLALRLDSGEPLAFAPASAWCAELLTLAKKGGRRDGHV